MAQALECTVADETAGADPRRKKQFNPRRHLLNLGRRGGREQMYLEVKWRLVWFRDEHPDWGIETKPVAIDLERQVAVFQAQVFDSQGKLMASGTKMESAAGFGDYVEKAETGAIGRALAVCGFGTQFAPELEEGSRVVDSPVTLHAGAPGARPGERSAPMHAAGNGSGAASYRCSTENCSLDLREAQYEYSVRAFGKPLCPGCQKKAARAESIAA